MKIRNFIYVLFSLAFLFSCSDENLPSDNLSKGEHLAKMQDTNNRIDMAEATNLVEEAIAFLDKEHPSESKSSRRVNSVSILRFGDLKSSMMKSGEYRALDISDTLAYVFNFGDSLGYVIISNDIRVESPLLAFTKKGSLVNGETDNPGLKIFLERLEGYILESIAKSGKTDEHKEMAVLQRGPYSGTPLDTAVRPLVTVEWGQNEPFNNKLEYKGCSGPNTVSNGRVKASCVATAVAQIMSYWEYPTYLGSISYLWPFLKKFKNSSDFLPYPGDNSTIMSQKIIATAQIANLFELIGPPDIYTEYGCTSSGASTANALDFLASKGFSTQKLKSYALSSVKVGLISLKAPFIARGCDANGAGCHAWVIDGLAKKSSSYYINNNWGWDGGANGYYLSGVFDPSYNFQDVQIGRVSR